MTGQLAQSMRAAVETASWALGTVGVVTQSAVIFGDWPAPRRTLQHTCRLETSEMETGVQRSVVLRTLFRNV